MQLAGSQFPNQGSNRALTSPNHWKVKLLVAQLCATLCDPMDCSPPGSPVHGILQARILDWVAISFSRGSCSPRDQTWVSRIAGRAAPTGPPGNSLERTSWSHRNMRWVIVSLLGRVGTETHPHLKRLDCQVKKLHPQGEESVLEKLHPSAQQGPFESVCLRLKIEKLHLRVHHLNLTFFMGLAFIFKPPV